MKRLVLVWAVAILPTVVSALSFIELDPKDRVVLPLDRQARLFQQCSRNAPNYIKDVWVPQRNQIEYLEAKLPQALEQAVGKGFPRGQKYARQYAGFVRDGHRFIYLNAFPRQVISDWDYNWRENAVAVCDGGASFFGVEYDLENRSFSHFEFNGAVP